MIARRTRASHCARGCRRLPSAVIRSLAPAAVPFCVPGRAKVPYPPFWRTALPGRSERGPTPLVTTYCRHTIAACITHTAHLIAIDLQLPSEARARAQGGDETPARAAGGHSVAGGADRAGPRGRWDIFGRGAGDEGLLTGRARERRADDASMIWDRGRSETGAERGCGGPPSRPLPSPLPGRGRAIIIPLATLRSSKTRPLFVSQRRI